MIPQANYPWQTQQWQQLMICKQQKRLPHALLLSGVQGLGKKAFALALSRTLLCTNASDVSCGQCHSCHLLSAESHPDFMLIEPETNLIKVDQIREAIQFVNETALQGQMRIIIINPANAMNIFSANALLKTLEEPGPNTLIILIGDQSLRLPATIASRCQKVLFQKPQSQVALEWLRSEISKDYHDALPVLLNLTDGAPLKAKEITENGVFSLRQDFYQSLHLLSQKKTDPLQMAAQFQENDMRILLNLWLIWLQDLLRFKMTKGQAELINTDCQEVFAGLILKITSKTLLNYIDLIKKNYANMLSSLNLNKQLMLEELLIRWVPLC